MKGYQRRQSHNSGKAQKIAERELNKRKAYEDKCKAELEQVKALVEYLSQHPDGCCEFMGVLMSRRRVEFLLRKAIELYESSK